MNQKIDRHFCVTTYVFDETNESFLFIKHKKLGKWLPPGGHVDPNELPDVAGIRETFEETGLRVELISPEPGFEGERPQPLGIQLNVIKENEHEHMDIVYAARKIGNEDLVQIITRGRGAMDGFAGVLSEEEIATLAESLRHPAGPFDEP